MSLEALQQVVASNAKSRFCFEDTGTLIRAVQGHSVPVELGYAPATPPAALYHGTFDHVLESIRTEGLRPQSRQPVDLGPDTETAELIGSRRSKPVVLTIDAAAVAATGHAFYHAPNGVWLTDAVPPAFIAFPCD